jgi:hypothetical protein
MFAAADQLSVAANDLAVVLSADDEVERAVRVIEEAQKRAGV